MHRSQLVAVNPQAVRYSKVEGAGFPRWQPIGAAYTKQPVPRRVITNQALVEYVTTRRGVTQDGTRGPASSGKAPLIPPAHRRTELNASPEPLNEGEDWTVTSPTSQIKHAAALEQVKHTYKDKIDDGDATMLSEYSDEIFANMRKQEVELMANPAYMDGQTEVNWQMRHVLIDWLLKLHLWYQMHPETLWIAVNIVDRFLSKRVVSRAKLQLLGASAILVAAKYEETKAPSAEGLVYVSDNAYTRDELLEGEYIVLTALEFKISLSCSPHSRMIKISKAGDYDVRTRILCTFFLEVTLLHHCFLKATPSLLAAIGMYASRRMLGGVWDDALVYHSEYVEEQLVPGFYLLVGKLVESNFEQQCVFRKYATTQFLKASIFAREWGIKHARRMHRLVTLCMTADGK